jgi:hypothetical protein
MGTLIITHKGVKHEYLMNTKVMPHVFDKAAEDILKWFPEDAHVDFVEVC